MPHFTSIGWFLWLLGGALLATGVYTYSTRGFSPVPRKYPTSTQDQRNTHLAAMGENLATSSKHDILTPVNLIADLPREHLPWSGRKKDGDDCGKLRKHGRLVLVGDVHGHLTGLDALLSKIAFDKNAGDHLILVGDLVNKGPDSAGVVQRAMELGASAVRGNHEDKVLRAWEKWNRKRKKHDWKADEQARLVLKDDHHDEAGALEDDNMSELDSKQEAILKTALSLSADQRVWLANLPLILRVGRLDGDNNMAEAPWNAAQGLVVVHAGLVPGLPLEEQDPWAVMNMRSLVYHPSPLVSSCSSASSNVNATVPVITPDDGREGENWSKAWNRHQNLILPSDKARMVVVYGHDARRGLQVGLDVRFKTLQMLEPSADVSSDSCVFSEEDDEENEDIGAVAAAVAGVKAKKKHKHGNNRKIRKKEKRKGTRYAFGLDSGCVYGRELSALILEVADNIATGGENRSGPMITHRIVQVGCEIIQEAISPTHEAARRPEPMRESQRPGGGHL